MRDDARRYLVPGLIVVGLVLTAVVASRAARQEGSWGRVERRDLVVSVELEGELTAVDSDRLGPPQIRNVWNFTIAWMVPEGSEVAAGQPVLRFDTTQLEQELQEKVAELDEAVKGLEKARTDLEIERRGLEKRLAEAEASKRRAQLELDVPPEVAASKDLEKARIDHRLTSLEIDSVRSTLEHVAARGAADLAALVGQRDRASARVEELRAALEAMAVKAPRDGTVVYVANRWNREKKKVGDRVWRAEKVLEIPDLGRLVADGEVAEVHMGRLEAGQRVTFRLDAHPDTTYGGRVARIHRAVETKSRSNPKKIVRIEVDLDETDTERMRPGMRLRGAIELERLENALVVPERAVFTGPQGAIVYVKGLAGERVVRPRLGARGRTAFAVDEGLDEGDRVLLRERGEVAGR